MFMQYFPSIWQERHVVYCRDQGVTRDVRLNGTGHCIRLSRKFSRQVTLRYQHSECNLAA